eukprot:6947889-Alexandrium_andersonii.AAC.1
MSASLVGSEMCIRDRHLPCGQLFGVTADPKGLSNCGPEPAPAKMLNSLAPVSYTHLTLPTICSV